MEDVLQTQMSEDAKYICAWNEDGDWVAGSVSQYNGINCEVSIAAKGKRPPLTYGLKRFFHYVFEELGCRRVTSLVYTELEQAKRINKMIGFKQEGLMRQAGVEHQDIMIMGLLKEELHPKLIWRPRC